MKKGELRKNGILDAAEKLFFEKGYAKTSVSDILDLLSISKGGFYHHFQSKEALLMEVLSRRVTKRFERVLADAQSLRRSAVDKLNILLRSVNFFENEESGFIALMMDVRHAGADASLNECVRQLTRQALTRPVQEALVQGLQEKTLHVRYPEAAGRMLVLLACDLNDETMDCLAGHADEPECVVEAMEMLNAYRSGVEMMVNAPYGSMVLFDLERVLEKMRKTQAEYAKILKEGEKE